MVVLVLYTVFAVAGIYLDYLAGVYVEAAYGGNVSLIFFLVLFFAVITLAFPLAVKLTPAEKPA